MQAITLKTARQYWVRIAILFALFGLMGLVLVTAGRQPLMKIIGVLVMATPSWMLFARLGWVARMDGDGVTLISGRRLPWTEFEKVVDVTVTRGGSDRWHNHYELRFKGGRGWVFDRMLANAAEVVAAIGALTRGERPTGATLVQ